MASAGMSIADLIKHLPRECIQCDGPECSKTNPRHRCSRCQLNYYCSNECQKKDWPNHKPFCIPVEEMRAKHMDENRMHNSTESDNPSSAGQDTRSSTSSNNDMESGAGENSHPGSNYTECPICLENPMRNPMILKECNHSFCSACIIQWQQYLKLMADLVVDFTGVDGVTTVEVKRKAMSCPYCRTENESIEDSLMQKAMLLATRAYVEKNKTSKETKKSILRESLECLNQVLDSELPIITAYYTKAEILLELEMAETALETLLQMFRNDEDRRQHPVMVLLEQQEDAVARFDRNEYERLKAEIVAAAEQHGMPATRLRKDAYFESYMLQCQALEKLCKWEESLDVYKKAGIIMDEIENVNPIRQRQFYFGLGRCLFEAGKYDQSIGIFDAAISMNRHFPGVHKYKALAHQQKGELNEAISTMNRAAIYETPWDEENQEECLKLYNELCQSRKDAETSSS